MRLPLARCRNDRVKAYLVLDLAIRDLAGFAPYIRSIPAQIEKHAGRYIVQGVEPTPIEGDWTPERLVIIEFPSRENAEAFLNDPDCKALFRIRHATTTGKPGLGGRMFQGVPRVGVHVNANPVMYP